MMRQNSLLVQAASCLKISDDGQQRYFQARSIGRARAIMKGKTAFIPDATCGVGKVSALTLEPAF